MVLTRSVQTLKADAKPKKIPKGSASNAVRRDNILLNDHSRDHLEKKLSVDLPCKFSRRLAKVFERWVTSSFKSQEWSWNSDLTQRNDKFFFDMIGRTESHKKNIVLQSPWDPPATSRLAVIIILSADYLILSEC
nr:hypothetical protein [Candidatus Prometheoarchaeum syntrophicum]